MPTTVIGVGALVDIAYVQESSALAGTAGAGEYASTPAGQSWPLIRNVRTSLNFQKDTFRSQERRKDRQTSDLRHGYHRVTGDLEVELSVQSFDDFLEATLGGTWASGVTAGAFSSVTTDAGLSRFTVGSATFLTSGFKVGDIFTVSGSNKTELNARYVAASIAETKIRVQGSTIASAVTLASGVTFTVTGKKVGVGNIYRSYTIERNFTDLDLYQALKGCRFNSATFRVPPSGLVGVTFGIMGQTQPAWATVSLASAYSSAPVTSPVAAVDGALYEGDVLMAIITGLEFSVNNNMGGPQVVGRNTTPNMLFGRTQEVTGTLTALFVDQTQLNKFVNETESCIDVRLQDASSLQTAGFIRIRFPRVKYTGGDLDDSVDTGIPITMPFTALKPTATDDDGSSIVIQRSNG